jgi:hypothetical protein
MDFSKYFGNTIRGSEAAVGADSSRPPPQQSEAERVSIPRPLRDDQRILLNPIIATLSGGQVSLTDTFANV